MQLTIIMAMSQLLILPLIAVMQVKKQYSLLLFIFASALTIHFVLYSWLYQTWLYIIMSVIIAWGIAFIYALDHQKLPIQSFAFY